MAQDRNLLRALAQQLQAVVDAGACPMEPTTVIDLSGAEPVILRVGRGDPARLGLRVDDNELS